MTSKPKLTRSGKYHQGVFTPKNPKKYVGDSTQIIYRSGLELRYFKWIDINSNITEWGSEEIVIPYRTPFDTRMHRYFPDLYIKLKDKHGKEKKYIIELKPKSQTKPPAKPKSKKSARYLREATTYVVNQAKWKHAEAMCKKNGMQFLVLTEEDIKIQWPA